MSLLRSWGACCRNGCYKDSAPNGADTPPFQPLFQPPAGVGQPASCFQLSLVSFILCGNGTLAALLPALREVIQTDQVSDQVGHLVGGGVEVMFLQQEMEWPGLFTGRSMA